MGSCNAFLTFAGMAVREAWKCGSAMLHELGSRGQVLLLEFLSPGRVFADIVELAALCGLACLGNQLQWRGDYGVELVGFGEVGMRGLYERKVDGRKLKVDRQSRSRHIER